MYIGFLKKTVSLTTGAGKSWYLHIENWSSLFSPRKKINSNWIKDHIVRPETLKLLQENIGEMLQDTGIGKDFPIT
jgi:hypothetical protein